jgi:predicted aspartyl protease
MKHGVTFACLWVFLMAQAGLAGPPQPLRLPLANGDGLYFIEAKLATHSMRLIVDTGATMSAVRPELVPDSAVVGEFNVMSATGQQTMARALVVLGVGGRNVQINVLVTHIHNADGVLGMDFLKRFKHVVFDLEHKELVLE